MTKKKTQEQFVKEIYTLVNNEYTIIGQYINTGEQILIKHNKCGLEYPVSPNKFLTGRRCPECSQAEGKLKQRKTHEQFIKDVFEEVGDEFIVVGKYIGSKKKVEFKHVNCGTVFEMQPSNFLTGQRCKLCSNKESADKQRHTTEKYLNDVLDLVGSEYSVLGEYLGNHEHILMKHNECGFEYPVQPSNFKGGKRCPKCQRGVQRTSQMYRDEVYELVGDEYTVIGDFRVTNETVLTRHNICGHKWESIPSGFLVGRRCPKCAGNLLKNHQQFVEEVFELVGVEYEVLSSYINSKEKVIMRHNVCGDEFPVAPMHFTSKTMPTRCPRCMLIQRAESRVKTTKEFIDELSLIYGDEYTVLGEYKGYRDGILVRHNPCGNEFVKSPIAIMSRNCKPCSTLAQMKTNEQFIEDIAMLVGDEYTPVEQYNGAHNKIKMIHEICGHVWKTTPHKFVSTGRGCAKCNESKGETAIRRFLESNNISFITQFRIEECRLQRVLPFDFAVFEGNNLLMLVEYDGEQHFKPVKSFGGEKGFIELQIRDKVKDKFCKDNNIELLRIPYYRLSEINNILNEALTHHRLLKDSDIYIF